MRKNPELIADLLDASRKRLDAGEYASAAEGFLKCFPANAEQQTEAALALGVIYALQGQPAPIVERLSPYAATVTAPFGKFIQLLLGYAHDEAGNVKERDACYENHARMVLRHPGWSFGDDRASYFGEFFLDLPLVLERWAAFVKDKDYGAPVAQDLLNWTGFARSVVDAGVDEPREQAYRMLVNTLLDVVLAMDPAYGGEVYFRKGEWVAEEEGTAAFDFYCKAIEVFPDHYRSHETLGRCYMDADDYENAIQYLERCREINENFGWEDSSFLISMLTTCYWLRAEELVEEKEFAAAETLFRKHLALEHQEMYIGPAAEDLWIAISEGYANRAFGVDRGVTHEELALRYAAIAVEVSPSVKSLSLKGLLLSNGGQQAASLEALKAGLALDAGYYYLHYALACTYAKMGPERKQDALAAIRKSLELNPGYRNNLRYESDFLVFEKDKDFLEIFSRKKKG